MERNIPNRFINPLNNSLLFGKLQILFMKRLLLLLVLACFCANASAQDLRATQGNQLMEVKAYLAYLKIYARMGLVAIPVRASTGAMGGNYSHEFHVLAQTGESKIYYEAGVLEYLSGKDINLDGFSKLYANEEEKHDPKTCPVDPSKLQVKTGIELGHIFYLGDKYSKVMEGSLQDKDGSLFYPKMGCYGIVL